MLATADLTGSKIKSVSSSTSSCKRIAVFCGSGKISIGCTTAAGSSDNLYQQAYPNNSWGRNYITTPSTNNGTNTQTNFYRVIRPDATAVVTVNGITIPAASFTNNFYYQFSNNITNIISSDKAIIVAQYFTTSANGPNCGNTGIGDPEMIYLNPLEQTISKVTLNSMQPLTNTALTTHFINAVLKNNVGGISSFKIDGVSYAGSFNPVNQNPSYAFARIQVSSQGHTITCDSGFNAISYGFGSAESYGYSAGTNVVDLYQYVTIQNQYATVNFPSTCKGTPFKFSITLPYQPTSLLWDFNNNPNLTPNTNVSNTSPVADSSFVKDGRTLYVYKLTTDYTFTATGTYPIKVTANNPTPDGCSGLQEINYDVQVFDKPIADFTYTHAGCVTDTVKFFDATNGFTRPTVKWKWEFGDATLDIIKNPKKLYTSAGTGTYNVKFTSYTDIGCISDTTKPLAISSVPNAKFGISDTTCAGKTIFFTDSSTIAVGTIVKWYWDYGNSVTEIVTSMATPRSQTYNTPGSYTITLIAESNTGCKSIVFSKTIIVRPNPVTDFTLPIVCLPVGAAQFNNLTTISDGTINNVTYKWDFGDATPISTAINPLHNYASTGPFTVKLTATSQYGCIKDSSKILSTVYAAPTSNFTVTAETCLRDSTTFTDGSNGSGNTITNWYWNRDVLGGANYVDTAQNFKFRYGSAGTYTVKMYFKTDKGCISDTSTKSLIINPLPTAIFTNTSPLCEMRDITFTPQSVPNVGTITRWYWDMGNTVINNFTNANPFIQSYTNWNTYSVKHLVETNKGCKSDTLTKILNVRPLPKVGFMIPEVCLADAAAVFTDTTKIADGSQASFTYNWTFNVTGVIPGPTPATSTIKNGSTKYNRSFDYQVKLKVTSGAGCIDSLISSFTVNGSIPKSDFNVLNPTGLCSNIPTQIQNTSTVDFGSITKIEIFWDFLNNPNQKVVDDTPTIAEIYSHLYTNFQQPATKTFTIKFVAYSGGTCVDTKIKTVTINASPKVQFVTMPGICFESMPRQITQASEIGNVAGASPAFMYYGNGVSNTGLFNPATAGAGTFPIKYVYTSNKGCQDSATRNITVWPSPTAKFGFSIPTCEKNDVTFTDSSMPNYSKIVKWEWDYGNTVTAIKFNSNPFTYRYPSASLAPYNATLKVTTDSGCVSLVKTVPIKVNYLPLVNFTNPSICLPDGNGTFNNTSTIPDNTENQFTYAWNFGDGGTDIVKNPTHQYSAVGPFTVKLKITSINGCIDSLSKLITTIYPQPHADFTINPSTKDVCINRPFGFTDISTSSNGAITTWNWNFGDGSPIVTTTPNPIYTYLTANNFTVTLFTYDAKGCVSDTMQKIVTVHAKPVAVWGYSSPTCEKNAIIFSDTSIANFTSISKWNWTFGDNTSATYTTNASFPKTYAAYNNYTATLQVMSDTGCLSIPVSKIIKVNPLPLINFSLPDICLPDGRGQFNDGSTIPDNSSALFSYLWNFGDPNNATPSTLKNPIHQYTALAPSGGYQVKLKITTKDGCVDSLTQSFNKVYPQPKADFSTTPTNGQICLADTVFFKDLSDGKTSPVNAWNWSFGDNITSTSQNPFRKYADSGTFKVKLYIFNTQGCVSDTIEKTMTVHPYPKLNLGKDLFVLEGGTIQIKPIYYATNGSFLWTPSLYLDSDTAVMPKSKPDNDITYIARLTGIGGCSVTDTIFIKVLRKPGIPNAFSPNGDGINDTWAIQYLESYPGAIVEVYDRGGRLVFNSINYPKNWDGTFNGKSLPVATYYYIINPKNGRTILSGSVTILR